MADVSEDDEMLLISKVAEKTGVSANTIRRWARDGELGKGADLRTMPTGPAWFVTVNAVQARAQKEHRFGRKITVKKAKS